MNSRTRPVKLFLIIAVIVLLVAAVQVFDVFYGPNNFTGGLEQTLYVSKGSVFPSIVDSLETKGIIRSRSLFIFVAKVLGGTNRIQTGKYVFATGISNVDLFIALRDGRGAALISVTIPEGLRARNQARFFSRHLGIDSSVFMSLVHDESFAQTLGVPAASLEGYLLPETYRFSWQPDEKEVISRQVREFLSFYTDSLREQAHAMGWTMHQAITLASIVEGEAVLPEERRTISGVYHNRLRKGMKLEADPTIQYLIEDGPRRVLYSDLKKDHPYNTYRNKGLPPGPVNNPGRGAILAALFPEQNNFLFFVANGSGGHWFSATYDEHRKYVRMYRRMRAQSLSQKGAANQKENSSP